MGKNRVNAFIAGLFLIILFAVCWYYSSFAFTVKDLDQMPEIIFTCYTDNSELSEYGELPDEMTFLDRNGNMYFTDDPWVCGMGYQKRLEEFAAGNLDDRIRLVGSCDTDELLDKCKLLAKAAANREYEIVLPEIGINALTERVTWNGFYYGRDGEICDIILHEGYREDSHFANDDRATEIYVWYETLSEVKPYSGYYETKPYKYVSQKSGRIYSYSHNGISTFVTYVVMIDAKPVRWSHE